MRYKSFDITDETGINSFLEKHGDRLAQDSVSYQGGTLFKQRRICFLYNDDDTEKMEREQYIAAMKQKLVEAKTSLLSEESNRRYWHSRLLAGHDASEQLTECQKACENMQVRIRTLESIIKEVKNGDWPNTPGEKSVLDAPETQE